jgi:hypothetical protein
MVILAWTTREYELLKLFIQDLPNIDTNRPVVPHSIVNYPNVNEIRVHTPLRVWNSHYAPTKLQGSWDRSNFGKVAVGIRSYIDRKCTQGCILRRIMKCNIVGCGKYGSANLLRLVHHCASIRMHGIALLKMSKKLDAKYAMLQKIDVYNCNDFNNLDPSFNYDRGAVAFLVCMNVHLQ